MCLIAVPRTYSDECTLCQDSSYYLYKVPLRDVCNVKPRGGRKAKRQSHLGDRILALRRNLCVCPIGMDIPFTKLIDSENRCR